MAIFLLMCLVMAIVMIAAVWLIVTDIEATERQSKQHAARWRQAFIKRIADDVTDVLRRDPRFCFVMWMKAEFMRIDKTLSGESAFSMAVGILREYLADEKIEFGDPNYSWSRDDAIGIAWAYECDNWERLQ